MSAVPDDLMQRLHDANAGFKQISAKLADVEEMDTKTRGELAAALRAAEREIEELTSQINSILHVPDHPGISSQDSRGASGGV